MNKKQVEEVIKAILARQYSWACVLMLQFNGYDPIQYIPYRTYIRLLKKNYEGEIEKSNKTARKSLDYLDLKST